MLEKKRQQRAVKEGIYTLARSLAYTNTLTHSLIRTHTRSHIAMALHVELATLPFRSKCNGLDAEHVPLCAKCNIIYFGKLSGFGQKLSVCCLVCMCRRISLPL